MVKAVKRPYKELPRTVARCEQYLDRMALVLERAGSNWRAFIPIVRRLERELAEAKQEEELRTRTVARLQEDAPPQRPLVRPAADRRVRSKRAASTSNSCRTAGVGRAD